MGNVRELNDEELEKIHQAARMAVRNCCSHIKRGFLDYLDFQRRTVLPHLHPEARKQFDMSIEMMKKRVHNEMSLLVSQGEAILEIYKSGGLIPPFGRTESTSESQ